MTRSFQKTVLRSTASEDLAHPHRRQPDLWHLVDSPKKLVVPDFQVMSGFREAVAVVEHPELLLLQLSGSASFAKRACQLMVAGSIRGVLQGAPIVMHHFEILNQGDRERVVATVRCRSGV